jgi:biopolymer transport protein ExbD
MLPKTLVKVGAVALLLALVVSAMSTYWLTTRTFEPVNMPVTLEAEKTQTAEFFINLREDYSVRINVEYSPDDWTKGKCSDRLWQDTDWKVYRLGGWGPNRKELRANPEEMRKQGLWPDGFRGVRGRYELDWSVAGSATCLNARHPRLRVFTPSAIYDDIWGFIWFACIFLGGAGITLMVRGTIEWLRSFHEEKKTLRMMPEIPLRSVIPLRRHRAMALIEDTPNFGLVYGFILWVLMFLFMILQPGTPKGLLVDFKGERTVIVEKNPWAETMAVYVDAKRAFLVNGKAVAREELRSKLQGELLRRGVWVVYFEADGNCPYMDAVYAMDTIQGLGAKMIWITPKTRDEWRERGAS